MGEIDGAAAATEQPSAGRRASVGAGVVPTTGMLVAPAFDGIGSALSAVGVVLAEAIVLYVAYGKLTRAVGPVVRELIASE